MVTGLAGAKILLWVEFGNDRFAQQRAILGSLLKTTHGKCLDDESLLTVMTEVEGILNSRPLTVEVLNDPTSLQPLSPVNILTMKSKVVSPPPAGEFSKPYIYIAEHVGDISNTSPMSFGLAGRRSTCSLSKNTKHGKAKEGTSKLGILLLYTRTMFQETTGPWQDRITNVNIDKKGLVRSVLLCMGERSGNENSKCELERPIDKSLDTWE